jgi:hypothetical protein
MSGDIEAPEITIVMEGILMQRREFSTYYFEIREKLIDYDKNNPQTEKKDLSTSSRRNGYSMGRSRAWTSWRNKFTPFVFLWSIPEYIVVEILDKSNVSSVHKLD